MPTDSVKHYRARMSPGRVPLQRVATLLQLEHICGLAKCIYCHKHRCFSNMPMLQDGCLLDLYSILHVSWCCASLFATPVGMVSHYQLCLLVWCLTIGHTFWCGASISALMCWCGASVYAMPTGVVPHYRQCLLVWCLASSHAFWCVA